LDEITMSQIIIHFLHRVSAVAVSIGIIGLFIKALQFYRDHKKLLLPAVLLFVLLVGQITLAAFVIWSFRNPVITTFHVWVGALMLGSASFLSLRCYGLLYLIRTEHS